MTYSSRLASDIKTNIDAAMDYFLDNELTISSNPTVVNQNGANCYSISWKSNPELGYLLKNTMNIDGATSIECYRAILDRRDYNVLISDGSLIQIAYKIKDEEVVWHRLCFFPCPIVFDKTDTIENNISTMFDYFDPKYYLKNIKMVTPIRFDYDINLSNKVHPTSHMTILKDSCRLPVFGPMSIGHFIKFIIQNFYSDNISFEKSEFEIPILLWKRSFTPSYRNQLFLESSTKC
ncbi:DUF2290 domain-containing protein [Dehalococcoides sp. UCH007]|uniref:DUF2290 domain-containing protein n=1 Tax=Dehalococcoides sp. UCH007 TaxID=1522671 RepID=UPI0005B56216|nr:DUF2290 domain-containing protein [Dehalococcoides sp. UCH007]BAQ35242.1 hypothetical protein UCH007_12840 [Dehalococcoides sp. UCH007]